MAREFIFFVTGEDEVAIINAESKSGDAPSSYKLDEVAEILFAYQQGLNVLED